MNAAKMSAEDFRAQYREIEIGYPDRDQRIATLFELSGWTQDEIAAETGMSQSWVARQLLFGRFLRFMTNGINHEEPSEGKFRGYWEQTDRALSDERRRFQQVETALGFEPTPIAEPTPILDPPPVARDQRSVEARVAEIAKKKGFEGNSGRISEIRAVVAKGAPQIATMIETDQVSLGAAWAFVHTVPEREQFSATIADVKQAASKYWSRSKEPREAPPKKPAAKPDFTRRPPLRGNFDNVNLGDEVIPFDPRRPIRFMPPSIEALKNQSIMVGVITQMIMSLDNRIDTEKFIEAVERMLAHQVVIGGLSGAEHDYAKEARRELKTLGAHLDSLIAKLTQLSAAFPAPKEKASA